MFLLCQALAVYISQQRNYFIVTAIPVVTQHCCFCWTAKAERPREAQQLVQSHTGRDWQRRGSELSTWVSEAGSCTSQPHRLAGTNTGRAELKFAKHQSRKEGRHFAETGQAEASVPFLFLIPSIYLFSSSFSFLFSSLLPLAFPSVSTRIFWLWVTGTKAGLWGREQGLLAGCGVAHGIRGGLQKQARWSWTREASWFQEAEVCLFQASPTRWSIPTVLQPFSYLAQVSDSREGPHPPGLAQSCAHPLDDRGQWHLLGQTYQTPHNEMGCSPVKLGRFPKEEHNSHRTNIKSVHAALSFLFLKNNRHVF